MWAFQFQHPDTGLSIPARHATCHVNRPQTRPGRQLQPGEAHMPSPAVRVLLPATCTCQAVTRRPHRKVVCHPAQAGDQQAGPVKAQHRPVLVPEAAARNLHSRQGHGGPGSAGINFVQVDDHEQSGMLCSSGRSWKWTKQWKQHFQGHGEQILQVHSPSRPPPLLLRFRRPAPPAPPCALPATPADRNPTKVHLDGALDTGGCCWWRCHYLLLPRQAERLDVSSAFA